MSAKTIEKKGSTSGTCVACRLSKVKCEMPDTDERVCKRCSRLGLECTFVASRRGKHNTQRDVARLGPAVRALLRTDAKRDEADATNHPPHPGALCVQAVVDRSHGMDHCLLHWHGNECQRMVVEGITTHEGRVALLKHWFMIGVRSGSCGLLGNVLILAHQFRIKLGQLTAQQQQLLAAATSAPSAVPAPQVLPAPLSDHVREWYEASDRLSCLRSQESGLINWYANAPFAKYVGDPETLQKQLEQEVPTLTSSVDFLICTAEIFIATPLHPEDRMKVAFINAQIWSQVKSCEEGRDAESGVAAVQRMEVCEPSTVRCLLMRSDGKRVFVPCTLQARAEYHADAQAVYSIFSLTPHSLPSSPPTASTATTDVALETEPSAPCAPSGSDCFPTSDLELTVDLASIAQMLIGADDPDVFVIDVEELGLELAVADVEQLPASSTAV